ncbi:MAG: hypothetical protein JWQ10_2670 [Herbaspirillum sp.]|nr:hypothetical protein [Herbaspirillum sp.]
MKTNVIRIFSAISSGLLVAACSGPPIQMYKLPNENAPSAKIVIDPIFVGSWQSAGVSRYEYECDQGKMIKQHVSNLLIFKPYDSHPQKVEMKLPVGEANFSLWFPNGDYTCGTSFGAALETNHVYELSSSVEKKGFFSRSQCKVSFRDLSIGVEAPVIGYKDGESVGDSVCKRRLKNSTNPE